MKTPVASAWIPGLVLVMAGLPGGLAQSETNRPMPLAPEASPIVAPATAAPSPAAPLFPAITTAKDPSLPAVPSETDPLVLKRQPPKLRLSPWTSEIVKLAESGIEASVILSFIENAGTFNLGANQIVYLNDLGLASDIITAMLRHDQEIVSGMRPLTIASELDWDLPFDSTVTTRSKALSKASPQIAAVPKHSATTTPAPVSARSQEALPEVGRAATTQLAAIQQPMADDLAPASSAGFSPQWQSPARKSLYRVREPYPEEITAPIILIGESRTPNTMIVVGFPRTTAP